MAIIHVHVGGGCEAVIREDGNELSDEHIHRYLCPNRATKYLMFVAGIEKKMCDDCVQRTVERFGKSVVCY